jgi:8-oxo-dGTP pyrophosphatase MutT (NUDIX family)
MRHAVTSRLDGFERRTAGVDGHRAAAVAIALCTEADGELSFLLTRRSAGLRDHAGQWALPGGGIDPRESPADAARRELDEEVGLVVGPDAVLGLLDDYVTRSGFVITPVVLWVGALPPLQPNPAEVASVHVVPVAHLDTPDSPRFLAIPESDRPVVQVPLLGTLIHAPTAAVLYQFREVVLHGRATRVVDLEQPVWAWR